MTTLAPWESKALPFAPYLISGVLDSQTQVLFLFPNGYEVSIINDGYGRDWGAYEMAMRYNDEFALDVAPFRGDVLGYLTIDDVIENLELIFALPRPISTTPQRKELA